MAEVAVMRIAAAASGADQLAVAGMPAGTAIAPSAKR
jgi:glutamate synthase domain-containing protein 2